MKTYALFAIAASAIAIMSTLSSAKAEMQTIEVKIDQSQMLQLPAMPGAIVVGNPAVADVSIQGQKLFIHGRAYGQTNLIILDLEGKQMATFNLVGTLQQDDLVTVYKGPYRMSLSCVGTCAPNLQVGDEAGYFGAQLGQIGGKSGLASGTSSAETKAPEAPQ